MSKKYLTLLVVPHDERNVHRVRVSYGRLRALVVGMALLTALVLVAVLSYGRVATRATRAEMLERENGRLAAENAKVDSIAANLVRTEQAYDQIRSMAGLTPSGDGATIDPSAPAAAEGATWDPAPAAEIGPPPPPLPGLGPSGWPLAIRGFVTARFTGSGGHPGIDIAAPTNTPVLATADGTVRQTGFDRVLGHFVVLEHPDGLESMYAHNALLLVERGDGVERAETIAYSGNSGRSTAPHLHYEVRREGMPIDPSPYLP